jgi:hypothetical protein
MMFFGALLCLGGMSLVANALTWWSHTEMVSATVVSKGPGEIEGPPSYEVEYRGVRLQTEGIGYDHKVGDVVKVRIDDPANPAEIKSNSELLWGLGIGGLFFMGGIALAVFGFQSKRAKPAPAV